MQNKAQFDDRIRNLLALAEDNSVESRTLLFSHICDLFLQNRPMESENQIRMLVDILNELIADVDIGIRKELCSILININNPPEILIKLISEDVIEVSGKLLEHTLISEEQLIYLVKFGSDEHRDYIGRRFGLTPLIRRELEKARKSNEIEGKLAEAKNKKVSLHELEEAEQNSTELNEGATANILELLRARKNQNINKSASEDEETLLGQTDNVQLDVIEQYDDTIDEDIPFSLTSRILQKNAPVSDIEKNEKEEDDYTSELLLEEEIIEPHKEAQIPKTQPVAEEWYWEIDRNGSIKYLSENSITVFSEEPSSLIGKDFVTLWQQEKENAEPADDFIALFEKRLPFRGEPFYLINKQGHTHHYLLNAIATFDLETGRFTGFRGSAQINEDMISIENKLEEIVTVNKVSDENHRPHFSARLDQNTSHKEKSSNDNQDEVASELLHNLSHEFRTPLNAIIGFSQMIDNEMWGPVSEKYRKNTKNIINAANQLKEAVNNILDSAKIEAGLIEPDPVSFSLKSVIQEAIKSIAPILESKELKVTGIDDNIDVILYNDKHCIILCLIKMITYATKNAPVGSDLHISILVNSNAEVRIEIPLINEDIDEKNAQFLFQKMHDSNSAQQKSLSKSSEFEAKISSGFGLTVAQDIAKLIGGELSTLSENGKISHIVLTISTFPI